MRASCCVTVEPPTANRLLPKMLVIAAATMRIGLMPGW